MIHACRFAAVSATALAITMPAVHAASTITGGGATIPGVVIGQEESLYNSATAGAMFGTYYSTTSGASENALLTDDESCIINAVTGQNGGQCNGGASQGAPGNITHYVASESPFSTSQISFWSSFSLGQAAAGNLIQLPAMGTGLAIPVVSPAYTTNSGVFTSAQLSDDDLCGIFSGKITNWAQITDQPNKTSGPLTVVYRTDPAGSTALLTSHLTRVCKTGVRGNSNITFGPTLTLAALFPNSLPPANFIGVAKISGMVNALVGFEGTATQAVGYLGPNYTSVVPGASTSTNLVVAQLAPVLGGTVYLPTTTNIQAGLLSPATVLPGSPLLPPKTGAAGANAANWVPIIETVRKGYPIVGYDTLDFAQCYADPAIAAGVIAFLKDHYTNASYTAIQSNNGFVTLPSSGAKAFLPAIEAHILANKGSKKKPAWNDDIQDPAACSGLPGR